MNWKVGHFPSLRCPWFCWEIGSSNWRVGHSPSFGGTWFCGQIGLMNWTAGHFPFSGRKNKKRYPVLRGSRVGELDRRAFFFFWKNKERAPGFGGTKGWWIVFSRIFFFFWGEVETKKGHLAFVGDFPSFGGAK